MSKLKYRFPCYRVQQSVKKIETNIPNVVTADIQTGIEKYIEDQTRQGKGFFQFKEKGKEYSFNFALKSVNYFFPANLNCLWLKPVYLYQYITIKNGYRFKKADRENQPPAGQLARGRQPVVKNLAGYGGALF